MATSIFALFTTYLIYPILAIVMGFVAGLIAKKGKLLSNKRLVFFTLISVLLLALPALAGVFDDGFMPYVYVALVGIYLLLGWYNYNMLPWVFKKEDVKFRVKILLIIFQLVIGMLLFALVFNLCTTLHYGPWAASSMLGFVLIAVLVRCYEFFIRIPTPIYVLWRYETASSYLLPDYIDHSKMKLLKVEVLKQQDDAASFELGSKFSDEINFGEWIKLVFEDYNITNPGSPIDVYSEEGEGWIFYIKANIFAPKRHMDPDLTMRQNRVREGRTIVAKRVKYVTE